MLRRRENDLFLQLGHQRPHVLADLVRRGGEACRQLLDGFVLGGDLQAVPDGRGDRVEQVETAGALRPR